MHRSINMEEARQAFDTIYNLYYNVACAYAQKFVSVEDSYEVAQTTFLKVWENRMKFRKWEHLVGFIYVTTRNHCLNILRDETRENNKRKAYSLHLATDLSEDEMDIHDRLLHMRLNDAIGELPDMKRKTLELWVEGNKISEIAHKLNITKETAQNYKSSAFALLRQKLKATMRILFFLYL